MINAKSPWNVYRTRFLVRARQLTEPLMFTDSLGREHSGQAGDYLVEFSDGVRRITSQALFEDIYVPLAPAQFSPPANTVNDLPPHSRLTGPAASVLARTQLPRWPDPKVPHSPKIISRPQHEVAPASHSMNFRMRTAG